MVKGISGVDRLLDVKKKWRNIFSEIKLLIGNNKGIKIRGGV